MEGLVSIVVMTASMLVIGWFVWGRLKRQEDADAVFREKLDADDERAREGREAASGISRVSSTPSRAPSPADGDDAKDRTPS